MAERREHKEVELELQHLRAEKDLIIIYTQEVVLKKSFDRLPGCETTDNVLEPVEPKSMGLAIKLGHEITTCTIA